MVTNEKERRRREREINNKNNSIEVHIQFDKVIKITKPSSSQDCEVVSRKMEVLESVVTICISSKSLSLYVLYVTPLHGAVAV